jgi:diguanylate cyclase (GGDEF)-like protein/PAS domain S-box-containing protein
LAVLEQVRVLRRRVLITLAGLALVITVGAGVALHLIETIDVQHQQVAYSAAERLAASEMLASAQQERSSNARGYLLTGDPAFLERRRMARHEFVRELDRLRELGGNERELKSIRELVGRLSEGSDRALEMWPISSLRAVTMWDHDVRPIQEQLSTKLHAFAKSARVSFDAARAKATESAQRSHQLGLGLGVAVLGALILLFLQFARTARELLGSVQGRQERVMFRLLDQVPVGIFVLDKDGAPYYANRSAERLLGSPAHFRARSATHLYRGYEAGTHKPYPMERTPLVRALQGETSEVSDMEIRRDDQIIPLLVHGCPVYDEAGGLTHAIGAFQDVRELTQKALVDALTGVPNRSSLVQTFARERLLCERGGKHLGVGIIDVDHFKAVNDTHGHAVGDRVLQRVARTVVDALRRTDIVGRWGGEEFVVLLPNSDAEGLRTALEKALEAVRRESFLGKDHAAFKVTFSGGAVLAQNGESLESSVARADALLYTAKHAGRNRLLFDVTVESSNPPRFMESLRALGNGNTEISLRRDGNG